MGEVQPVSARLVDGAQWLDRHEGGLERRPFQAGFEAKWFEEESRTLPCQACISTSTLRPWPPCPLLPAPTRPLTATNPSLTEVTARYSPVQHKPAPAPDLACSFLPRKPISAASKAVDGRATPCPDAVPSSSSHPRPTRAWLLWCPEASPSFSHCPITCDETDRPLRSP